MNISKKMLLFSSFLAVIIVIAFSSANTKSDEITLPDVIDQVSIKQQETLNTTVQVRTMFGSGSGTIISKINTQEKNTYKYIVLTNAHVTHDRVNEYLSGINSITGEVIFDVVDTGCSIITFSGENQEAEVYCADVLFEDVPYDISIISFVSDKTFNVAMIANEQMLKNVRVFDEIIAVGCQLGQSPTPTTGIISRILVGDNGDKHWILYQNTSHISPGSSGGGLFKEYDGHYYLIGIPFSVTVSYSNQIMTHLAYAISITTVKEYIDETIANNQ